MKLRNIILAICALVAFSACSNDDNQNAMQSKTKLSVKVVSKGVVSKAEDPHELEGEANINTLAAFVFDASSKQTISTSMVNANTSHEYIMNDIPAGDGSGPVMFVLVANAPSSLTSVTSYDAFESALAELADQSQTNLTMSTPVITSQATLDDGDNYVGFEGVTNINNINEPLWLTRLPARLQLKSLKIAFTRTELLGRNVTINSIYFARVKQQSRYFSVADWGIVNVTDATLGYTTVRRPAYILENNESITEFGGTYDYVMENLDEEQPTQIVINATLSATDEYNAEQRSFVAAINQNGGGEGAQWHKLVKRNHVYDINITFGNNSFDGTITDEDPDPEPEPEPEPEPTPRYYLSVMVDVVGWGVIEQNPVID